MWAGLTTTLDGEDPLGEVGCDLLIRSRLAGWLDRFPNELNPSLRVGKGAGLFSESYPGQQNVRQLRRFHRKDFLQNDELA